MESFNDTSGRFFDHLQKNDFHRAEVHIANGADNTRVESWVRTAKDGNFIREYVETQNLRLYYSHLPESLID